MAFLDVVIHDRRTEHDQEPNRANRRDLNPGYLLFAIGIAGILISLLPPGAGVALAEHPPYYDCLGLPAQTFVNCDYSPLSK